MARIATGSPRNRAKQIERRARSPVVQGDPLGRAVRAVEHRRNITHDPFCLQLLEVGGFEVVAGVHAAGYLGPESSHTEQHETHAALDIEDASRAALPPECAPSLGIIEERRHRELFGMPAVSRAEPAEQFARIRDAGCLHVPRTVQLHERGAVHALGSESAGNRSQRRAPSDTDNQIRDD